MNQQLKTRTKLFFLIAIIAFATTSCQQAPATETQSDSSSEAAQAEQNSNPLEGTWKLLAAKWNADTKQFADNTVYKIFTGNRFATIFYHQENNTFTGGGGGTYAIDGEQFTEHLEYFSFDTTAVGSSQTFSFEISDGILHQSGTLKTEKYPNYQIHEFYERVEPGASSLEDRHPLVGVWNIEEASYGGEKSDITAEYGKVIKIFTPGHFYGVFFNPETGYFNGIAFGAWKPENDEEYTEVLKSYTWDNSAVGNVMTFNWRVEDDKFYQTGKINTDKYKDYEILEVSSRLE